MKFSRAIRYQVYTKYGGHCAYCGTVLKLDAFQIDHIKPVPVNHVIHNLNPSCHFCNYFKSDLSIEDFRSKIIGTCFNLQFKNSTIKLLKQYALIDFYTIPIIFYFEKSDQSSHSFGMELEK